MADWGKPSSNEAGKEPDQSDGVHQKPICLLVLSIREFTLVFSADKMVNRRLVLSICLLISVDRAGILVFSADKTAVCQLAKAVWNIAWRAVFPKISATKGGEENQQSLLKHR